MLPNPLLQCTLLVQPALDQLCPICRLGEVGPTQRLMPTCECLQSSIDTPDWASHHLLQLLFGMASLRHLSLPLQFTELNWATTPFWVGHTFLAPTPMVHGLITSLLLKLPFPSDSQPPSQFALHSLYRAQCGPFPSCSSRFDAAPSALRSS